MNPVSCTNCGNTISQTAFECPRCGAAGPNLPGRPRKGWTRGRWTITCVLLFTIAVLFPPMHQRGELTVNGRTTVVDHSVWPAWIGMASDRPDVGYTRNGQFETVHWNISRSINRPVWNGVLWMLGIVWALGMFIRPSRKRRPVSRYPQEVVSRNPAPAAPPARSGDRSMQPSARGAAGPHPGQSVGYRTPGAFDPNARNVPPPGGRYR